jgi:hypothetical protein
LLVTAKSRRTLPRPTAKSEQPDCTRRAFSIRGAVIVWLRPKLSRAVKPKVLSPLMPTEPTLRFCRASKLCSVLMEANSASTAVGSTARPLAAKVLLFNALLCALLCDCPEVPNCTPP